MSTPCQLRGRGWGGPPGRQPSAPALLFQDNVLNIINQIMDVCIPQDRAPRDFCVKFPEEIRHDNLAGQLWFGAEVAAACLGPGSRRRPCLCMSPGQTCSVALNTASGELLWAGSGGARSPMAWRAGPSPPACFWGPGHSKSIRDLRHERNPGEQVPES